MSETHNGGPAFPRVTGLQPEWYDDDSRRNGDQPCGYTTESAEGMSLLQWYTGHALAGLLASEANVDLARVRKQAAAENGLTYSEQIGVEAVELARCAMLAARKAGGR
jgi:hypothetical protein